MLGIFLKRKITVITQFWKQKIFTIKKKNRRYKFSQRKKNKNKISCAPKIMFLCATKKRLLSHNKDQKDHAFRHFLWGNRHLFERKKRGGHPILKTIMLHKNNVVLQHPGTIFICNGEELDLICPFPLVPILSLSKISQNFFFFCNKKSIL